MDELEIIRQLREQNELLRLENEMLKARISELEARLANMRMPILLRTFDVAAISKRIRTIRESLAKRSGIGCDQTVSYSGSSI
ncbi:hypothetical protein [Methanothrix soehngenii]|jgi:regulator of replication initiation timing|uniref:hypothetical protein n=1 Tax=Methanothrix soehngenii TaxID=2223 RepID=UPI00064EA6EA